MTRQKRFSTEMRRSPLRLFLPWGALVLAALVLARGSAGASDRVHATGEVYVVSVAGGVPRALALGADPEVSPDGRQIAYVRNGQLWLMRPDGSEQRQLTTGGGGRPFWSPDGRRLAFTKWNVDPCYPPPKTHCAVTDIWTVDVDGSGERKLFELALQPAWSPDGRLLLFRKFLGPAEQDMPVGDLEVAWADGSHERTLFSGGPSCDGTSSQPAWSPDGKWIVFERTPGAACKHRLYLTRADGTHSHQLTGGTYPAWSPNGRLIAFTRLTSSGVWVIPTRGGTPRRIARAGSCPTWSPGGRRLALLTTVYRSQPEPQPPLISTTLSVVGPDGQGRKTLAQAAPCVFEGSFPSPPSWSPDGRSIYFSG